MGIERRNGVDAAIALLKALAAAGGVAGKAELATAIGVPRASFHRIAMTLATAGLIEVTRGQLKAGPALDALIETSAIALERDDALRRQRGQRRTERPALAASGADNEPIPLTPPRPRHRRGRFRIGFSNASMDNPWRVALVHSIEYAAASIGDRIEWLAVRHAGDDPARQIEDIDALLAAGVDGLIVSAVAPNLVGEAVARVMAQDIPVVLVDRGVATDIPHTSFVTTDDAAIGRLTALWLAEKLNGRGAVLMLPGDAAAEPAQLRLEAALKVFAGFSGIDILAIEWTGWHRDTAYAIVHNAIGRWGEAIAGVWCDSGLQGVGSLDAFIDAGRLPGTIPPHTGGDLNLAYKLAIRHQVPLAAVDYPPAMGIRALEVLYSALRGQWVPKIVEVPSDVILTRGATTRSIRPHLLAEEHVRWDLPDDLILASGLGPAYNPQSFRIHYPGNIYNRSAARTRGRVA